MADARKIILDCDPGQDDAIAILLALASPDEIEVLAITTVGGNVPLRLTESNARRVCELAGRRDIAVHAGCPGPFLQKLVTAEAIHGETGLNGTELPAPTMPLQSQHGVDAIIDLVMAHPAKTVTLVPTGPLTNVAVAMTKQPAIIDRLQGIVLMGGGRLEGNITPMAEFNIYVDPHAAAKVFASGAPIVMHGLDVTHKALITPERLAAIRAINTPIGRAAAGLLNFYNRFDQARYDTPGAPLHDPCTIAYLINSGLFEGKDCFVEVDTMSPLAMGTTVVDWWGARKRSSNAKVVFDVDAHNLFRLLTERLARL